MEARNPAVCQFLRAVRGRRSQIAFSRRLGFKSNPAADWESGRRAPSAAGALQACLVSKIDVMAAFTSFHPASAPALGEIDDAGVAAWLNALRGSTPLAALARRLGRSRSSVSRWFSGRCRPSIVDLFDLVHAITGRLSDLVAGLVDIDQVPALADEHYARQLTKRLAYEEPWTEAIMRVIETRKYRALPSHVDGWIAAELAIDEDTETRCLEALKASKVIELKDGRFVSGSLSVDTVGTQEQMKRLKAHWTQVALQRVRSPQLDDIFSYNLMSISRESLSEIQEVIRATFREIRAIAAAPQDEEIVAHVNLQLLTFGDSHAASQPILI